MTDQMNRTGDATNCDKTNYGFGKKNSAETNPKLPENMSWWAGRTSMLETMTVGQQIGCHIAANGGSGQFKLTGAFARANTFDFTSTVYRAEKSPNIPNTAEKPTIEFTSVSSDNMEDMLGGKLYTAVDSNGTSLDIMSDFGPSGLCGLCSAIGGATATSPVRDACKMGAKNVRYDIQDSLGIYDRHANDFFNNTVGLYDPSQTLNSIKFTYYDVIGTTNDTLDISSDTTGDSPIERLLGVDLRPGSQRKATPTPACIGDLHAALAPYCEIDRGLFHVAKKDAPPCTGAESSYETSCPNPRWSNDHRITFPRVVPPNAVPARTSADYDRRAARLSYCANGPWNFTDPDWYKAPPRGWEQPDDTPGQVPFPPSRLDPGSKKYVYCDEDRLTPDDRAAFCAGTDSGGPVGLKPEGYMTHFGVRAGLKSKIGDVCHKTLTGDITCIVYANTTVGNFKSIQSILDAFPDRESTRIRIVGVPVAEHVVSQSILAYMTDVSTLYYNDPTDVGPDGYVESGGTSGGFLGKAMGISYDYSNALFQGMCHATAGSTFFAHLYAAIEKFRASSDLFHFVNFDGIARSDRFRLELSEEEVYPEHVEDRINFGSRIVTIASAFTEEVAAAATVLLQTKLGQTQASALPARRFRFGSLVNPTDGCTRILLEQPNITLTGLEFRQGGICTKMASENLRIPIIAGGPRVVNLRIRDTVCVDCVAGLVGVRGGDPALGAGAVAANVDVENMTVFNSVFLWTSQNSVDGGPSRPAFCSGTERMSTCQKATLPGIESSFARIVGSPVVASCPSQHSTAEHIVNEFCDLVMPYGSVALMHAQHPGSPIASFNSFTSNQDTDCSSSCFPDMYADYNTLYGNVSPSLKPCCDGLNPPEIYTCPVGNTEYTRTEPTAGQCSAGFANCFWNRMRDDRFRPEWIDTVVDQTTLAHFSSNTQIDDALCATFYAMCFPLCTLTQTDGCNVCLGNQTFVHGNRCKTPEELAALVTVTVPQLATGETMSREDALDRLRQIRVPPPCATTGFSLFSNGHLLVGTDDAADDAADAPEEAPGAHTAEVLSDFREQGLSGQVCSALGCPNVAHHTASSLLTAKIPTCTRAADAPTALRQAWYVKSNSTTGLPPFGEPINIVSPGDPTTNFQSPVRLDAGLIQNGATGFVLSDAYNSVGTRGVFMAQIRFVGQDGTENAMCLTRNATQTLTGTEPGGRLSATPCVLQNAAQDFMFVQHRELGAWRLQIPQDPFMCLTLKTDPIQRECPDQPASFSGSNGKKLCGQKYPHLISSSTPAPVVMPCFPCAVGVDVGGTGMGPVVSSVLNLPSIVRPVGTVAGTTHVQYIPLSTSPALANLVLAVNLETGMCFRFEPILSTTSFAPPRQTGSAVVDQVPCSLLEGAPVAQLQEAAGTPDVCADAAGLLVAPCLAKTGGLSFVDASSTDVANLCTRFRPGQNISVVSAGGGRGAVIDCVQVLGGRSAGLGTSFIPAIRVLAKGFGFKDNDVLVPADPAGPLAGEFNQSGLYYGYVSKLLWQPHESAETPASLPIVGPTTEVFNVTALFDLFGEASLFDVFAASIQSATSAYIVFAIEVVLIVSAAAYHLYAFFKRTRKSAR